MRESRRKPGAGLGDDATTPGTVTPVADTLTVIDGERTTVVGAPLTPDGLAAATGWTLKPEGLCQADVCVPVRDRAALQPEDGTIDIAAFAAALNRPLVFDPRAGVVALGESAATLGEQLRSLTAPDFTLADLDGVPHSFKAIGRKKKLLVAWASW